MVIIDKRQIGFTFCLRLQKCTDVSFKACLFISLILRFSIYSVSRSSELALTPLALTSFLCLFFLVSSCLYALNVVVCLNSLPPTQ